MLLAETLRYARLATTIPSMYHQPPNRAPCVRSDPQVVKARRAWGPVERHLTHAPQHCSPAAHIAAIGGRCFARSVRSALRLQPAAFKGEAEEIQATEGEGQGAGTIRDPCPRADIF